MNLNEKLATATPDEKKEITRDLNKMLIKQITLFALLKIGIAVGTHLLVKKLAKNF